MLVVAIGLRRLVEDLAELDQQLFRRLGAAFQFAKTKGPGFGDVST